MTTTEKLSVWAPATPGVDPTLIATAETMPEARQIASRFDTRRDLHMQDVVIRLGRDGKIIERCGPCR